MFSGNLLEMNYNVIRETVDEINIDKYLFIGKSPDFLFVLSFYSAPINCAKLSWNVFYRPKVLTKQHKNSAT